MTKGGAGVMERPGRADGAVDVDGRSGWNGSSGRYDRQAGGGERRGDVRWKVPVLIYDGDCAFCTSSAELAKRYLAPDIAILPWQNSGLTDETRARAEEEVLLLHPDGRRIWGGADAVAVLLLAGPHRWAWPMGWLLRLPAARAIGAAVYRWVSRNRHRMPGGVPACRTGPAT
ncbi:thiol-disulfide oxidoreductase DCC family protein [Allosalinactinospora lopnorensis]|uniref:thiol-disulfide oxidoreductase DCC family protein n=1 Tax=Allosalinactinospora lopnorensis TaxID=1352348 RepID=UPI000B3029AA|nr:DUF393 domain-containing protein [Allosalinactinospora lopnorensis]